ncbi:hypothetical protein Y032_0003g1650 [Ancylostoma ceylanicum]|nr:hypothetical protein Y032_0003g1650 [Ancylostoma ceylanicum]
MCVCVFQLAGFLEYFYVDCRVTVKIGCLHYEFMMDSCIDLVDVGQSEEPRDALIVRHRFWCDASRSRAHKFTTRKLGSFFNFSSGFFLACSSLNRPQCYQCTEVEFSLGNASS